MDKQRPHVASKYRSARTCIKTCSLLTVCVSFPNNYSTVIFKVEKIHAWVTSSISGYRSSPTLFGKLRQTTSFIWNSGLMVGKTTRWSLRRRFAGLEQLVAPIRSIAVICPRSAIKIYHREINRGRENALNNSQLVAQCLLSPPLPTVPSPSPYPQMGLLPSACLCLL